MAKQQFEQFCPICGSKKFDFFRENKTNEVASVELYKCERCKNVFAFPLEMPKNKAKQVKEVALTKSMVRDTRDGAYTSLGNFEVHIYWKILGAVLAILGIFYVIASALPFLCYSLEGFTQCQVNTSQLAFLFEGTAIALAGFYFLVESMVVSKKVDEKTRKVLRLALVVAILVVIVFMGKDQLFIFQWY